jgi:hypothetical protein
VLYDVSSAAFEGRTCPLGAIGHPRDGVKGRLQIVYGLPTRPAVSTVGVDPPGPTSTTLAGMQ